MNSNEDSEIVNQVLLLLIEIDKQLSNIKVQTPSELKKVKGTLLNKDIDGFKKIRRNLYNGFRRLDEIGINNSRIDELSSKIYLLVKQHTIFHTMQ